MFHAHLGAPRHSTELLDEDRLAWTSVPGRLGGFDLDECQADVGQRDANVDDSGPRRSPRPSTRQPRRRWPRKPRRDAGDRRPRWIAASSYRPITWLTTTVSAGTSARRAGRRSGRSGRLPPPIRCLRCSPAVSYPPTTHREVGWLLTSALPPGHICVSYRASGSRALDGRPWWRFSSPCWWLRSQTHRKGTTHCTGLISHSTAAATGAPVQRSHPRP